MKRNSAVHERNRAVRENRAIHENCAIHERDRAVRENRAIHVVFVAEPGGEPIRDHGPSRSHERCLEAIGRVGVDGGAGQGSVIVEWTHGLIDRDVVRISTICCPSIRLVNPIVNGRSNPITGEYLTDRNSVRNGYFRRSEPDTERHNGRDGPGSPSVDLLPSCPVSVPITGRRSSVRSASLLRVAALAPPDPVRRGRRRR